MNKLIPIVLLAGFGCGPALAEEPAAGERLRGALDSAGETSREMLDQAGARLSGAAGAASERAGELLDATRETSRETWETTRDRVADAARDAADGAGDTAGNWWDRGVDGAKSLWNRLTGEEPPAAGGND